MKIPEQLKGGLVVSCQPVSQGPLDKQEIIVAMAMAVADTQARGLRIEEWKRSGSGAAGFASGYRIVKRLDNKTPIVITPELADVENLINAGAGIIAVDATDRIRPVPVKALIERAKQENTLVMADCASIADGIAALEFGADIIGTTLSGYTQETQHLGPEPDFGLIDQFARLTENSLSLVMAEGRFNTPELAACALQHGADCVTVGSAITRLEHVVDWFSQAMQGANG